jgi:hypothetical protein
MGRLVKTRDQDPGPCSSQQTRKNHIHSIQKNRANSSQQKLISISYLIVKEPEAIGHSPKGRFKRSVELIGFEPTTSSLQSWRSPS